MSDDELIEIVKEIDSDDELYKKIFNEPLFDSEVSLEPIVNFFVEILK